MSALKENKPIIFFINPPYATASNNGNGEDSKGKGATDTMMGKDMVAHKMDNASNNLYAQFLYRITMIKREFNLTNVHICLFSPTLFLTGTKYKSFRTIFLNEFAFNNGVQFKASHFADVADNWGISFSIWDNGITNNIEETIKDDTLEDNIYVFTPKGDIIELPKGSTPVDFAYKVHSKIGDSMVGALVNNQIVPLNYALQDGDVVKINTSKTSTGPNEAWLSFVKLTQTKNKIKAFYTKTHKEEYIIQGRECLERELKRRRLSINEFINENNLKKILKELKINKLEDLYINLATNKFNPTSVVNIIYKEDRSVKPEVITKNELDINVFMTTSENFTAEDFGWYNTDTNTLAINMENNRDNEVFNTVAHECRHAWQYTQEEFTDNFNNYIKADTDLGLYFNQPVEKDASNYASDMCNTLETLGY